MKNILKLLEDRADKRKNEVEWYEK